MTRTEARELCKTDPIFLGKMLGYDVEEQPHRELFDTLNSPDDNKLVLWPRGHFKTSCVVIHITQEILKDPDVRCLIMQATLPLTKKWLKEIRSHFDYTNSKSRLPELFPEFCGDKRKVLLSDSSQFTVPARRRKHLPQSTVTCASPRAAQTGQHYTRAFFDDLVTPQNFRNIELLDKLEEDYSHFLPLMDPGSKIVMTGTRYSFVDLYGRIIAKEAALPRAERKWAISIKECDNRYEVPKPKELKVLFPRRITKDNRAVGFTLEYLAQLERDNPEMFGPQYLNRILMGSRQLFPPALIGSSIRATSDKEFPKGAPTIFMIDGCGFTGDPERDEVVVAVGSQDAYGRVWVKDVVGGTFTPYQFAILVLNLVVKHQPWVIMIEKAQAADVLAEYLKNIAEQKGMRLRIDFHKSGNKKSAKHLRIATLEGGLRNKNVFLCASITDFEKLEQEMTEYPRGRHDDRPDAVAMLVSYMSQSKPPQKVVPTPNIYVTGLPPQLDEPKDIGQTCGADFVC